MNYSRFTWIALSLFITTNVYAVNPRPEFVFTKSPQTLGVLRTFALDIGDLNLDGYNDVFVASYHDNYFGPSQLWLNNGDHTFSLSAQSFSLSDVHGVAIRDLNGDTYPDIFLVSQAQPSRVFFNDGTGTFTAGSQGIGVASDLPFEIHMGDVDHDGDLDAFLSCGVGQQLWLNDGAGGFTLTGTPLPPGRAGCINLADVNGDTYLDIFISLIDLPDEVWLNDGSGSFANSGQALGPTEGYAYPASGDVDGDGDIDMVVGNSGFYVAVWLNQNNTGTFIDAGYSFEPGAIRVELFDADFDGDLDLITAHPANGTKLWENAGTGAFSLVGSNFGSERALDIACTDLDGDLDCDVVLGYGETSGGNPVYFNETISDRYGTVTDIDGNSYWTIKIGDQVWMAENLRVTHYRNGDLITLANDSVAWVSQLNGAYCNYAKDSATAAVYGRLYNWYAAADNRKLAPAGWHVPTVEEWEMLFQYSGGNSVAGRKLKEAGLDHWLPPNCGTNEAGFTALPGGYRGTVFGIFADLGNYATFWTADAVNATFARYESISYDGPAIDLNDSRKFYGFSIRCVKDTPCCHGTVGNADNDSGDSVDIADLQVYVDYLFFSGQPGACSEEFDTNGDTSVDISDLQSIIDYLFFGSLLSNCA